MEQDLHFHVVVNAEEQYSIWPDDAPPPTGWRETGFLATRQACLDHIQAVWTDMRPLSLRRALGEASAPGHPPAERVSSAPSS